MSSYSEYTETQLKRLVVSKNDFEHASSGFTFLLEEADYEKEKIPFVELRRLKCFENSAIISFMRPLTESKNGTILSLNRLGFKFSNPEKRIFEKIKEVRNDLIAHSGEDEMHFRLDVSHHCFKISENKKIDYYAPWTTYDEGLVLKRNEVESSRDLAFRFREVIEKKLVELAQERGTETTMYVCPNEENNPKR